MKKKSEYLDTTINYYEIKCKNSDNWARISQYLADSSISAITAPQLCELFRSTQDPTKQHSFTYCAKTFLAHHGVPPLTCLPFLLIATDPSAQAIRAMAMMGQREHVAPSMLLTALPSRLSERSSDTTLSSPLEWRIEEKSRTHPTTNIHENIRE